MVHVEAVRVVAKPVKRSTHESQVQRLGETPPPFVRNHVRPNEVDEPVDFAGRTRCTAGKLERRGVIDATFQRLRELSQRRDEQRAE